MIVSQTHTFATLLSPVAHWHQWKREQRMKVNMTYHVKLRVLVICVTLSTICQVPTML